MNLTNANKAHVSGGVSAIMTVWAGNAAAKYLSGVAATAGMPMGPDTELWMAGAIAGGAAWILTYAVRNFSKGG